MYITLSEKIQSQSTDSQKILPGRSAIEDRGWRRRVVIEKVGAASSVVWNPCAEKAAAMADLGDPAWRGMVCLETGNVADNVPAALARAVVPSFVFFLDSDHRFVQEMQDQSILSLMDHHQSAPSRGEDRKRGYIRQGTQ